MKAVYETEHLLLKPSNDSFAEMVADYCIRNRSFLAEWEPVREEEFYTSKYQKKLLCNDMENNDSFRLWIFKKGNEEKIIVFHIIA